MAHEGMRGGCSMAQEHKPISQTPSPGGVAGTEQPHSTPVIVPHAEILPPAAAVGQPKLAPSSASPSTIQVIDKRGLGRPIGIGLAIAIVLFAGSWVAARTIYGDRWLEPFRQALHGDLSAFGISDRDHLAGLTRGEVAIVVRGEDGQTVRVAAQREELRDFEKEVLFFLRRREEDAKASFEKAVGAAFDAGFSDVDTALEAYADWFFAWERSWVLMKEALVAGGSEAANIMSPGKIWEAVTARLRGYLMDNYQSRVLQPEMRQPRISRGLESAFQDAHQRFRTTIDELDRREREFIAKHTRLLEAYPAGTVSVRPDWGAQKWKIPAHYAEDQAEKSYRSVAVMGTAIALGPLLKPVLARVGESIMGRVAVRTAQSRSGQIVGTFLGPETLGVSILIGLAVDYGIARLDERLSRGNFIAEHRLAVDETRQGWQALARQQLAPVVTRWYADTRQAIVILGDKPRGGS